MTVAGDLYPLINEDARLNLFTPGRAVFTVEADATLTGIVIFSSGYQVNKLQRWFIGFIESCTHVDAKQQRLFCREISAVLYNRLPLALRDVDIRETLASVGTATGLEFVVPEGARGYTTRKAPAFYNLGNGYYAMDSLAVVYGFTRPIWQQQVDGKVFVGSWDDSRWPARKVDLPRTWESKITSANGATVPALPALRPGVLYNNQVLTGVEFSGLKMKLTWAANPWSKR